jgi:hypothetical protein
MTFRRKSPERAYQEFVDLMNYGVKLIHAVDNILDFRYFTTLLPELAKLKHDCEIFYEIKSNVTYEQVRLLRSSGCRWLQPGIESLSTPVFETDAKRCYWSAEHPAPEMGSRAWHKPRMEHTRWISGRESMHPGSVLRAHGAFPA